MNWFKRTNKNEGKKSENKSVPNNETQKEIESKERKSESGNIKEELKTKDELIQRLNDERKETSTEIVAFGRDINTTLEKLIERLTP